MILYKVFSCVYFHAYLQHDFLREYDQEVVTQVYNLPTHTRAREQNSYTSGSMDYYT